MPLFQNNLAVSDTDSSDSDECSDITVATTVQRSRSKEKALNGW